MIHSTWYDRFIKSQQIDGTFTIWWCKECRGYTLGKAASSDHCTGQSSGVCKLATTHVSTCPNKSVRSMLQQWRLALDVCRPLDYLFIILPSLSASHLSILCSTRFGVLSRQQYFHIVISNCYLPNPYLWRPWPLFSHLIKSRHSSEFCRPQLSSHGSTTTTRSW